MTRECFRQESVSVDVCVVGGGMAGVCAALAAARHGAKVALVHERPVLGGNSSSEQRVHVCGADRSNGIKHMRETGILEELRQENLYRNPHRDHGLWDLVLYQAARQQENLELILNCTVNDATMEDGHIRSVTGWQLTTETFITVEAKIFIDCSGDAVLAPLSGASFRMGREGRDEFGESIAPEQADDKTMGSTCYFFMREHDTPQTFRPPAWAHTYKSCDDLPGGANGHRVPKCLAYWWIELGGEDHMIHDTERLRDELLPITLGVVDHLKNHCEFKDAYANWAPAWIQMLPAKRESRRYIGDHVLCQGDVESEGRFDDLVAYGGWSMDDHHTAGFRAVAQGAGPATIFHHAPSPYGIPYRSLYSKDVGNLMFAGRCMSATHAAMSSTRVQGTGSVMGQAAGTAAAMAIKAGELPKDINARMKELQQALIVDDCYLPWVKAEYSALTMAASLSASRGNPDPVRDGIARQVGDDPHAWVARPGEWIAYAFGDAKPIGEVSLQLDTAMDELNALTYQCGDKPLKAPANVTPRAFRIEGLSGGTWSPIAAVEENYQRHIRVPVNQSLEGVRYVLNSTWCECDGSRVYGFSVK